MPPLPTGHGQGGCCRITRRRRGAGPDRPLPRAATHALRRGLAGICVPTEYGGQGLTLAHQNALNEEIAGYDYPARIQIPTFTPCMAVILEFGTEEQKKRHIPAILRARALDAVPVRAQRWLDVAGAQTTAMRDGEEWVMNGSKIWTTGAWWADWGLCLARTNWDVPKHRGLTVFMLPIHQPGIEIHRIEMLNGSKEFCQEFMTDVRVPDTDRIGEVDQGWTVGTRWMFHERMLGHSPYVTIPAGYGTPARPPVPHQRRARQAGRTSRPVRTRSDRRGPHARYRRSGAQTSHR